MTVLPAGGAVDPVRMIGLGAFQTRPRTTAAGR
jgi:hypothetical protein